MGHDGSVAWWLHKFAVEIKFSNMLTKHESGGHVDTFILDFEKAFDTPPHELLKSKLFSYGIGGKTLTWIDSFLCFRQQRVVVNGVKPDWGSDFVGCLPGHRSWSFVVLFVHK